MRVWGNLTRQDTYIAHIIAIHLAELIVSLIDDFAEVSTDQLEDTGHIWSRRRG